MLNDFFLTWLESSSWWEECFSSNGSLWARIRWLAAGMPGWIARSTLTGCGGNSPAPEHRARCGGLQGRYYVLDGHRRVAAARALDSDFISAHVIEVS